MKKRIIIISILIVFIGSFLIGYIFENESYAYDNKEERPKNSLSIYVETAEGSGSYNKNNAFDWQNEDVALNDDRSSCEKNSEIIWDDNAKTLRIKGNSTDKCTLYFDRVPGLAVISSSYSGTYDGQPRYITVAPEDASATIYYSLTSISRNNYRTVGSTTHPDVRNAGTTTVFWCVESGTTVKCGSNNVILTKATPTLALTDNTLSTNNTTTTTLVYNGDGTVSCTPTNGYGTCSISGNTITFNKVSAGTEVYTISATEGANYRAATDQYATVTFTDKQETTLSINTSNILNPTFDYSTNSTATITYNGNGTITCTPVGTVYGTCTVNGSTLKFVGKGIGTTQFRVTASETDLYLAPTEQYVTVNFKCFTDDTEVDYYDKKRKKKLKKKIKDIEVGDEVYVYDEKTDEIVRRKVKKVHINPTMEILHLIIDGQEIKTTREHSFYVENLGYIHASALKEGFRIACGNGTYATVERIEIEALQSPQDMYCLELEDGSSFTVGKLGIVAHAVVVITLSRSMKSVSVLASVN